MLQVVLVGAPLLIWVNDTPQPASLWIPGYGIVHDRVTVGSFGAVCSQDYHLAKKKTEPGQSQSTIFGLTVTSQELSALDYSGSAEILGQRKLDLMKEKVQNLEQIMKEAGIDCAPYLQEAGLLRVSLAFHDSEINDSRRPVL
jgi:hypothetical protein